MRDSVCMASTPPLLTTPGLVLEGPPSPGSQAPTISSFALVAGRQLKKKKSNKNTVSL